MAAQKTQTNFGDPTIFIHSVVLVEAGDAFQPDVVAGHSLGEFSALVAAGALSLKTASSWFRSALQFMQAACVKRPAPWRLYWPRGHRR